VRVNNTQRGSVNRRADHYNFTARPLAIFEVRSSRARVGASVTRKRRVFPRRDLNELACGSDARIISDTVNDGSVRVLLYAALIYDGFESQAGVGPPLASASDSSPKVAEHLRGDNSRRFLEARLAKTMRFSHSQLAVRPKKKRNLGLAIQDSPRRDLRHSAIVYS